MEIRDPKVEVTPSVPTAPVKDGKATAHANTRGGSLIAPLRLPNFRRLVAGQVVSRFGDAFYYLALPWLVLRSTSSPVALTIVLGVASAALGVSTLVGGVLADRYGSRTLMLAADIARLLIVCVIAGWAIGGGMPIWALAALAGLLGVAGGLFYPASLAMTPHLVPSDDLQAANSFDQIAMQMSNLVGPSVAGTVLGATRLAYGFVIDAASFAVSIVSLFAIRMPHHEEADVPGETVQHRSQKGSFRDGLTAFGEAARFLLASPFLSTMLALSLLANFAANGLFDVALPLLLKQWVGVADGPRAQGFILSGFGVGSVSGALIAGIAGRFRHKAVIAIVLLLPTAALLSSVPLTHSIYVTTGLFAVMGLFIGITNVFFITLIQRGIPKEMLGRVMSLALLGSYIGSPLSIAVYGTLASLVPDISILFLAGAALFAVAATIALTRRVIREAV